MADTLTTRQRRFVREYLATDGNAAEAARRAGYSPNSARTIAYRLLRDPDIQSALAQHFVDEEKEVSEALRDTILRLRQIISLEGRGSDKKFMQAARLLLEYTRLAAGVLGLNVKREKAQEAVSETATVEDLIEQHRREIEQLERLRRGRSEVNASEVGEGVLQ